MLRGWSDGSRCRALSPVGTGSADKCPWSGGGGTQGSHATSLQLWQPGGVLWFCLPGRQDDSRQGGTPSCVRSFIRSTDVYWHPRMWGHRRERGGPGRGTGGAAGHVSRNPAWRSRTPARQRPADSPSGALRPPGPAASAGLSCPTSEQPLTAVTLPGGARAAQRGHPQDVEKPHCQVYVLHATSGHCGGGPRAHTGRQPRARISSSEAARGPQPVWPDSHERIHVRGWDPGLGAAVSGRGTGAFRAEKLFCGMLRCWTQDIRHLSKPTE